MFLVLVLRVAVKRLQSKITQNTKKQTNSRKSRTGLHKTGARTEGGHGSHGSPKRRVKPVTHIRLASVGEENICGGVVRGIGSTDIRIRSRGVLYSSTSTVVSTRSLLPVNMSRVAAEKTGVSRQVRVCQHCRGCEGCGSAITACPRFSCSLDEADTANNIKRRRHRNYAVHGNMFTTNSTRC